MARFREPSFLFVPGTGIEPVQPQWPQDFLTTMAFATRNRCCVCGLDFLFIRFSGCRLLSLYTFSPKRAWLGIATYSQRFPRI